MIFIKLQNNLDELKFYYHFNQKHILKNLEHNYYHALDLFFSFDNTIMHLIKYDYLVTNTLLKKKSH